MFKEITEITLSDKYTQILTDKEAENVLHISSCCLDQLEYAERVGYVRAIREMKEVFKDLLRNIYPD